MSLMALLSLLFAHSSDFLSVRQLIHNTKEKYQLDLAEELIQSSDEKNAGGCTSVAQRFYLDGSEPCCTKIASMLAPTIPLVPQNNSTDFGSCDNPAPRLERKYSVAEGSWPQPDYHRQQRSQDELEHKSGRVLLWKVERGDGCGTHAQYLLYAWALAHARGWTFGGEIPRAANHRSNKSDFVFFNSNCNCMKKFTGMPKSLTNRLENDRTLPAAQMLKDKYALTTDCTGNVEAALQRKPIHRMNRAAFRHFKSRDLKSIIGSSASEVSARTKSACFHAPSFGAPSHRVLYVRCMYTDVPEELHSPLHIDPAFTLFHWHRSISCSAKSTAQTSGTVNSSWPESACHPRSSKTFKTKTRYGAESDRERSGSLEAGGRVYY
jgi:hypothetical protein